MKSQTQSLSHPPPPPSPLSPQKKRAYSLPRTQPTKSSSCQKFAPHVQIQNQPQITEFRGNIQTQQYVHKMNIDYGRIQEPGVWPKNSIPNKEQSQKQNQNQPSLQQERSSPYRKISSIQLNIKSTGKCKSLAKCMKAVRNDEGQSSNKKTIVSEYSNEKSESIVIESHPIMSMSHSKNISPFDHIEPECPQQSKTKKQTKSQQKPKLKEVVASKMNIQHLGLLNDPSSLEPTCRKQQSLASSSRNTKRSHYRIVKSYVGGSKMQIKLINYPDSSQYMKLCGYMK